MMIARGNESVARDSRTDSRKPHATGLGISPTVLVEALRAPMISRDEEVRLRSAFTHVRERRSNATDERVSARERIRVSAHVALMRVFVGVTEAHDQHVRLMLFQIRERERHGARIGPILTAARIWVLLVPFTSACGHEEGRRCVGNGAPALNKKKTFYFTGRSDNFDRNQLSTFPNNARLDPESIRVSRDGKSVFISDEYGPFVYEFARSSGKRLRAKRSGRRVTVSAARGRVVLTAKARSGRRIRLTSGC